MQVDQFPEATFALTAPIEFGTVPADGEQITATATGDLTLHGVTSPVTFDVTAQAGDGRVGVLGKIPVLFADYDIENPSTSGITTEDNGLLEFVLVFEPGVGAVTRADVRVGRVMIPAAELTWRFSRASGRGRPARQHGGLPRRAVVGPRGVHGALGHPARTGVAGGWATTLVDGVITVTASGAPIAAAQPCGRPRRLAELVAARDRALRLRRAGRPGRP